MKSGYQVGLKGCFLNGGISVFLLLGYSGSHYSALPLQFGGASARKQIIKHLLPLACMNSNHGAVCSQSCVCAAASPAPQSPAEGAAAIWFPQCPHQRQSWAFLGRGCAQEYDTPPPLSGFLPVTFTDSGAAVLESDQLSNALFAQSNFCLLTDFC